MSDDVTNLLQLATAAFQEGRFSEVERVCSEVLATDPNNHRVMGLRAVATARSGRAEEAIIRFKELLRIDPQDFSALGWLSTLLRESGRSLEAAVYAERACRARPADPEAAKSLALCQLELERYADAAISFRRAIAIDPKQADYYFGLGTALDWLGVEKDSAAAFRRGVDLAPDLGAYLKLGQFAQSAGNTEEATGYAAKALDLEPRCVPAHILMAKSLSSANRREEAETYIGQAEQLAPNSPEVQIHRASWFQANGRFDLAEAAFQRSLKAQPYQGRAYFGVVSCRKFSEADRPTVEAMQRVLAEPSLDPAESAYVHYALGKAFDNLGAYHEAMAHFDEANIISRQIHPRVRNFDRSEFERQMKARASLFSSEIRSGKHANQSNSSLPILIVGMPRSGTTLVEQILSSHPKVGAAGERGFWSVKESEVVDYENERIKAEALRKAADEYCTMLERLAPGAQHVTDKNPANVLLAGLIHLALPEARIVCTRRNPLDMALSIYMTPVASPPPFACDRDNICFAYKGCERLIEKWRQVIPSDRFMEVDYEEMVTDREHVTRSLVAFCGLGWDDACLHPEDNVRTVMTPSYWQVRQAVYSTSIDRWKNYEPWLGAFRQLFTGPIRA